MREWPGLLLCLLVACLYFFNVPNYVLGGDNGEFVVLSRLYGNAHPPGYPVYLAYLRMMNWLPGSPAKSAGLATAILGLAQIGILYAACRSWGFSSLISAVSVAFWATSYLSISLNTHAEVFALNGLLAAAVLFLAAPRATHNYWLNVYSVMFIYGLGLCNHHSLVFLAPIVVFAFLSAALEGGDSVPLSFRLAVCTFSFISGLLPNLLLLMQSSGDPASVVAWRPVSNLEGLLWHFLRKDYGTFLLAAGARSSDPMRQISLLFESVLWCWTVFLPFAFLGFWDRLSKKILSKVWWFWVSLALSLALSGPFFASRFNILPVSPALALLERFHYLPALLLVLPVAAGLSMAKRNMPVLLKKCSLRDISRLAVGVGSVPKAVAKVFLVLYFFFFGLSIAMPRLRERGSSAVQIYLLNVIHSLPKNSELFILSDHKYYGFAYLQEVLGVRPDVKIVNAVLLKQPWYRRRVLPSLRTISPADLGAYVLSRLDAGSPVFVDTALDGFYSIPGYQYGLVRRLVHPSLRLPDPRYVYNLNVALFDRFEKHGPRPVDFGGWTSLALFEYEFSWCAVATYMESSGQHLLWRKSVGEASKYSLNKSPFCRKATDV